MFNTPGNASNWILRRQRVKPTVECSSNSSTLLVPSVRQDGTATLLEVGMVRKVSVAATMRISRSTVVKGELHGSQQQDRCKLVRKFSLPTVASIASQTLLNFDKSPESDTIAFWFSVICRGIKSSNDCRLELEQRWCELSYVISELL